MAINMTVYKKILTHLNVAVLLFNPKLILTYINASGEILLADSARHLLGLAANQLFKTSDSAFITHLKHCLSRYEPLIDRELQLVQLTQIVTVNFSATPLWENDQLTGVLVELQQVDRQLQISKEEQLLAQQHANRLLAKGLAHEIKNPLGGIRGAAQLLEVELDDSSLKEYTRIIIQESDRLKCLVNKILGPNKPSQKQYLNIHEILERIKQLVTIETTKAIQIETDYDPSIPELIADKNQLIQAMLNIAQNAVQAIRDNGKITLRTRIQRYMTIGRKSHRLAIKIDIIDNGSGIKPELMNQIFYPLITGRAEGSGLGLSIAQSLINQHEGTIECQSQPGCTIFSIYLPLKSDYV